MKLSQERIKAKKGGKKGKENRGAKIRKLEDMFRRLIVDNGSYRKRRQKTLGEEH